MVEIIKKEWEGYSQTEAQQVHEDIAEAIECLHNKISLEVGEYAAAWIIKAALVEAERYHADHLVTLHDAIENHEGKNLR